MSMCSGRSNGEDPSTKKQDANKNQSKNIQHVIIALSHAPCLNHDMSGIMSNRELVQFDRETLEGLEGARKPVQVLSFLNRLSEGERKQVAATLTLDSTLGEIRLAAIQLMTVVSRETFMKHGPEARKECEEHMQYLRLLQVELQRVNTPAEINPEFIYGSEENPLLDMDDVQGSNELHMMLRGYIPGRPSEPGDIHEDWKHIITAYVAAMIQSFEKEIEQYPIGEKGS